MLKTIPAIRVKTVYPLDYDKNGRQLPGAFRAWQEAIAIELSKTRAHLDRIRKLDCIRGHNWAADLFEKKQAEIARIEQELEQEKVLEEALEILIKGNN